MTLMLRSLPLLQLRPHPRRPPTPIIRAREHHRSIRHTRATVCIRIILVAVERERVDIWSDGDDGGEEDLEGGPERVGALGVRAIS